MDNPSFVPPPQGPPPAYTPAPKYPQPPPTPRQAWHTSESQNVYNQQGRQAMSQQNNTRQPAAYGTHQQSMCSGKTVCITILGVLGGLAMMALTIGLSIGLPRATQGIANAISKSGRNSACEPRSHFTCSNGNCVALHWACDGENDCGDGSDERTCLCNTATQYMCKEGKTCIAKSALCDGRDDCPISATLGAAEDELACSCTPSQTQCANGVCVSLTFWCDGVKDCRDGSDELSGCENSCPNGGTVCPSTGVCMNKAQFCDHISDCSTGLDEQNCACKTDEYQCGDKQCISKLWLCDGTSDCTSGEDETLTSCNTCGASQLKCKYTSNACVSADQKCDGVNHCADTSDESGCVSNNGTTSAGQNVLNANYKGVSNYYICADNWSSSLSDRTCKQMGYGTASTATAIPQPITGAYLSVDTARSSSNIMSYLQPISSCQTNQIVTLTCKQAECGVRAASVNPGPYVVNGLQAAPGAWPWQVLLVYDKSMTCGGSIIASSWIMTAAHCAVKYTNTALLMVRAGSIYYADVGDPFAQVLPVDRVFVHPYYGLVASRNVFLNDVALLHLRTPITFTNTIKPICLPPESINLQQFKVCVATGFGNTRSDAGDVSSYLLQGKMQIMTEDTCRKAYTDLTSSTWKAASSDFNLFVCAGNSPSATGVDTCQGDSGGPFVCKDQQDVWTLVGVTSFGFVKCQLSVFARVSSYLPWVNSVKAPYN